MSENITLLLTSNLIRKEFPKIIKPELHELCEYLAVVI